MRGEAMLDISFEINGRKVNPNNVSDVFERAILQSVRDSVNKSVGSLRCSEHGTAPKITCKGRDLSNLSFEISGCCQKLMDSVKTRLK
jgi:hypothetical protein